MKRIGIVLCIMFSFLLHLQLAQAEEIYKWVDEKGTVHFTDDQPGTIKSSVEPENTATRKGDELARQRILKEATPNLKLPQKSYYDAHPEERYLDQANEINKELIKTTKGSLPPKSPPPPTPPKSPPPPQPRTRFLIDQGDAVSDSQTGEIMWKQGDAVVDKTGKLIWIY